MAAVNRLKNELKQLIAQPIEGCAASPVEDNIMEWMATITGPKESPYEGGSFNVSIAFTINYPFEAPKLTFTTKVFNPSIDDEGKVCLEVINQWTTGTTLRKILQALVTVFVHPNPDSILNLDAAGLLKSNKVKFEETVREWTQKYAM